jgi:hypothetical protein
MHRLRRGGHPPQEAPAVGRAGGGKGLREKAVQDAIALSEERYCSVAATLRGVAEVTNEYTIVEDE